MIARLLLGLASGRAATGAFIVLTYHRVLPQPDPLEPDYPDRAQFELQMRWLSEHANVLPLAEADRLQRSGELPARTVCITFDDGYQDNVDEALPILRRYALPATFFIATAYLDGRPMWNDQVIEAIRLAADPATLIAEHAPDIADDVRRDSRVAVLNATLRTVKYYAHGDREQIAAKMLESVDSARSRTWRPMMQESGVRALAAAGMEIGSHTDSHPILAKLDDLTARIEIERSRDRLASIVGRPITSFAYPNGRPGKDYTKRDVELVRSCGFERAVSTSWGAAAPRDDRFQLPRLGLHYRVTSELFWGAMRAFRARAASIGEA